MGARGRGAIPKPKPAPKANGRPLAKVAAAVSVQIQGLVPKAITVLTELMDSENDLYRLRAAIAVLEHGSRPSDAPVDPEAEAKANTVHVKWVNDYRASTG